MPPARLPYPPTRRDDVRELLHGVEVPDPYRWLEDGAAPEVRAWAAAQGYLTRAVLDAIPGRAALVERLRELLYLDAVGIPVRRGDRVFFGRRHKDREKAVVYWRPAAGGEPRVLFDPNAWSEAENLSLGSFTLSWDGRTAAYQVRRNNSDEAELRVIDVESGAVSAIDAIAGGKYASASWTPDGRGFYYTWLPAGTGVPEAERPGHAEIRFHALGTDPAGDPVVRPRTGDPSRFHGAEVSRDGRFLLVTEWHGWSESELHLRDLADPSGALRPLVTGSGARWEATIWDGALYARTTQGAPLGRIVAIDLPAAGPLRWRELVAERPGEPLAGFSIVGGRIAAAFLRDATERIELFELDGRKVREQPLPGLGSTSGLVGLEDDDTAYYAFSSYLIPREIHQVSVSTGETRLFFRLQAPIDPSPYAVEQRFCASPDGTRVPWFVVARRDLPRDGSAPALLWGYGGFQVAETPDFRASLYAWLERGGVFAAAVLRGGSEYGEPWHQAGMGLQKQHTFDDFLAVAADLCATGLTSAPRLGCWGGSNGGLLVGAAITQRPEQFGAAICAVPLLDMVRYHRFGAGRTWIPEYGSAEDEEQFRVLHSYSPYHRVRDGVRYPAVLLLSAAGDDRVDPLHARKMCAALQAASSGGPALLRIEHEAGHGGADRIRAAVEETADVYAFALAHLGAGR